MLELELDVELVYWKGAVNGHLNMAKQFGSVEVNPVSTNNAYLYFMDIRKMIDRN